MARERFGPVPVLGSDGQLLRSASGGQVTEDFEQTTPVTDVAALPEGPATETVSTDAAGICTFYGPDGWRHTLYIDFGIGPIPVTPLRPVDAAIDLADGGSIADGAISTAKLADAGVTPAKLDRLYVEAGIVDAAGDLLVGTAADTVTRLPVGASGRVLTADATAAAGVAWKAPVTSGISEPDYIISVDSPEYGAVGDGVVDDSAAFEAAWTKAASMTVDHYGSQNNRRGRAVVVAGAGRYRLTTDGVMMRALSTYPVSGLAFRGVHSDVTEILFAPSSGTSTAALFQNYNSWYDVSVESMTLMSAYTGTAANGPAVSEQTSLNPQAAAQNWRWNDVKIRGVWRYGNRMSGDNCNSEWFHHYLGFGTDCVFGEGWIYGAMTTDQQLNIDFVSCQLLSLLGGKILRMDKGGAIRVFGGQLLLNGGVLAFDLRGRTHDGWGSTEFLHVIGPRTEIRDSASKVLYCEWGAGEVYFGGGYSDNVIPQTHNTFTFSPGSNRGPQVAFESTHLTGRHEYVYNANKWQYPGSASYRNVKLPTEPDQFIVNTFDTSAGATDLVGGRVLASFEDGVISQGLTNQHRYRLQQVVNSNTSYANRPVRRSTRIKTNAGGTGNGASYAYLPVGAEIVSMRLSKAAIGSSTNTTWSMVLTDGDGTVLATIDGTTTGKQWGQACTATVPIGVFASTDAKRQLTLTCANLPTGIAPSEGAVTIEYVA